MMSVWPQPGHWPETILWEVLNQGSVPMVGKQKLESALGETEPWTQANPRELRISPRLQEDFCTQFAC